MILSGSLGGSKLETESGQPGVFCGLWVKYKKMKGNSIQKKNISIKESLKFKVSTFIDLFPFPRTLEVGEILPEIPTLFDTEHYMEKLKIQMTYDQKTREFVGT